MIDKVLSIIIPTYNMEVLLKKDLDSLVTHDYETMSKMEVIVVIDGANDRSSEIAHAFQDKYPNTFKVIDKENGNYGSCINKGLMVASGKYVKVMDADDSYQTSNLKDFIICLQNSEADLVLNDYRMVNEDGQDWLKVRYKLPSNQLVNVEDVKSSAIISELVLHSITYKKELFDEMNYHQTEGISYTDQEWIIIPMRKVKTLQYFNKDIYLYLCGRQGQTIGSSFTEKGLRQHLIVLKSIALQYDNFAYSYPSKKIVEYKICALASRIYKSIIQSRNESLVQQLREFDLFLKNNANMAYELINSARMSRFVSFRFINWWRNDKMPSQLSYLCRFLSYYNIVVSGLERRVIKIKG